MVKRAYPPGVQGRRASGKKHRRAGSEYGQQLVQKQFIKRMYGVMERQLRKYFNESLFQKGDTRENLIRRLEMRLDNVIFRLGLAKSRASARQMASHGLVLVNGKRVTIPSYQVKAGEVITLKEKTKKSKLTENLAVVLKKYESPSWLFLDKEKIEGKVLSPPGLDDLGDLAPLSLIIQFYSR